MPPSKNTTPSRNRSRNFEVFIGAKLPGPGTGPDRLADYRGETRKVVTEDAIGTLAPTQTRLDRGRCAGMYCAMVRTLALLRHGLASGQGPDAALAPEGVRQVERLAAALRANAWRPDVVLSSPYARALESARTFAR